MYCFTWPRQFHPKDRAANERALPIGLHYNRSAYWAGDLKTNGGLNSIVSMDAAAILLGIKRRIEKIQRARRDPGHCMKL